jgi:hypothetical protein
VGWGTVRRFILENGGIWRTIYTMRSSGVHSAMGFDFISPNQFC